MVLVNGMNFEKPNVVVRKTANFRPSLWGDRFVSFSVDVDVIKSYDEQIEVLKEKVKKMLMASISDSLGNVCFINLLYSLGLSYQFESEIRQQLTKAFEDYANLFDNVGFDLYTVADLFRLFRQHGHLIPCDVFEKFTDTDGKFKEDLIGEAKGMLSLYEASQLAMEGEQILDDALTFTKPRLEALATLCSPHLAQFITNCLDRPLHRSIPRLAARHFIAFYEEEESKNEILLKLSKIDFNRLQLLYQEELCQLTRWYRNLDISSNLVYARDRIVEIYFCWGYSVYFEPKFSKARIIAAKAVEMLSIIDDTYDAYGTIEELRTFTDAIQRMESTVEELPEYMKYLYQVLLQCFDECDQELANEGFSYNASYAREAFKEMARVYLIEAEWLNRGFVPTVDEYLSIAQTSGGHTVLAICCLLGVGEDAGPPAFEWINSKPKIHVANQEICRLCNDIASHEFEQKRGHVASFIECYMKQYGVSKEEATEACNKMIDNAWKKLNDFVKESSKSILVTKIEVNLARAIDAAYRFDDGYTNPEESLQFLIESLLIQPIPI